MVSEPTVPVQIDSVKWMEHFQRARCMYFRVDFADVPMPPSFTLPYEAQGLLVIWGNWAVLSGSSQSKDPQGLFVSPELISQTLQNIEAMEGQFLDLSYLWLPNELLLPQGRNADIITGDVYRLSLTLFYQCYRFVTDTITEAEWLEYCMSHPEDIALSPTETTAFREWRRSQIQQSKARYHQADYTARQLPKKRATE